MRLTPPEPDFTPGEAGFDGKGKDGLSYDLLGRKGLGKQLSDLVERIDQPLVIALDGAWGSGKSHFLKLWTGAHRKENGGKAKVIYFDAFQHDYLDDPLVSLVGAILQEPAEGSWTEKALGKVKSTAAKLLRPAARIGLALGTAGVSEVAGTALDMAAGAVGKEAERAIDALWKNEASRKTAMKEFRDALTALAKDEDGKPQKLVFIIDELDRCRPDYALGLLEVIKHFFAVESMHFVLGTNLAALRSSVKARYGLDIDAAQYLQKFISVIFSFSHDKDYEGNGPWFRYFESISELMGLSRDQVSEAKRQLKYYEAGHTINLRDVQRICSHLVLLPRNFNKRAWAYNYLAVSISIIRIVAPDTFTNLRLQKVTFSEIDNIFSLGTFRILQDNAAISYYDCWNSIINNEQFSGGEESARGAFGNEGRMTLAQLNHFITTKLDVFHFEQPS